MVPFAVAGAEYGALASRGSFARVSDALSSPDLATVAWGAAAFAAVVLATRGKWTLALMLLLGCGVSAAKFLGVW